MTSFFVAPRLRFWDGKRLPVLLQTEAAECGLACLAMIASFWGHHVDVVALRRKHSASLRGMSLRALMRLATALELQTRPLKLDMEHLRDIRTPCILHWDMNHYVVLKQVHRRSITVHDPSSGERTLTFEEASPHFTGVAVEVQPGPQFTRTEAIREVKLSDLVGRVSGLRSGLAQIIVLGLALQVCVLLTPFFLQWVVDEALVSGDRNLITVLGLGFILLVLIQAALTGVRSWVTTALATNLSFQWLGNAFAHLMRLPSSFFEKRHVGDIVSRFGSIQQIQRSVTTQVTEACVDGVLAVTTLAVMFVYNLPLALLVLGATCAYLLVKLLSYGPLRAASAAQIVHSAKQQSHFLESARGAHSVRLFQRADDRRASWLNMLALQFNSELKVARIEISAGSANVLLFGLERVAVIWLGALFVLDTRLSVGMLFAFMAYRDLFVQRSGALVDKMFELRLLRLHANRVSDILLAEPENRWVGATSLPEVPDIEFRGVSFQYSDSDPQVLRDVSFKIPCGQCVAITGASASGKTTLVKLLLGLLEPTTGEILVGGVSIRKLDLDVYRGMIGSVLQDDQLFAGSVADNVAFFDSHLDQPRLLSATQLAAIHGEIIAFPMGYETMVGEGGTGLSGGQRQRLLLARALYKNPSVLVMDEATSHLDVCNEQVVNRAIQGLALTRILVAHRPETIAAADRVFVLQQGAVVQDFMQERPQQDSEAGVALGSRLQDQSGSAALRQ